MLTVDELLMATRGKLLQAGKRKTVSGVVIDSRAVRKNNAFVAIIGDNIDGHRFVPSVVMKGAAVVIVSRKITAGSTAAVIQVKDTKAALGKIAAYYRSKFMIPLIAVTGSAGKTTTKELIASFSGKSMKILKNEKSFNNHIGVPLTLLKLKPAHKAAVLELGTNQPGDISYLAGIVRPTAAVFTNIGESHLEKLKTPAGVYSEKTALLKYTDPKGTVIYNSDDKFLKKIKSRKLAQRKISFGFEHGAKVRATEKEGKLVISDGLSGKTYRMNNAARYHAYNVMAAVCCADILGVPQRHIAAGMKVKVKVSGRMALKQSGGVKILDDSYNANPVSFKASIETLSGMPSRGKKYLVCGDMLELGSKSKGLHELCGKWAAEGGVDVILGTGKYSRFLIDSALNYSDNILAKHFERKGALHRFLDSRLLKNDIVLVKGSRSMNMDKTVDFLMARN